MINIGIIGGSGYTGGELIRLLLNHPKANINFIYSTTRAGKDITTAHPDLLGQTDLKFTGDVNLNVDLVFLCLGHGNSTTFLTQNSFSSNTKIIDLSNDFRLHNDAILNKKEFIYGLPETNKNKIKTANYIANPGCFATAIQLALLPLAKANILHNSVHINAVTGSTGAGVKPSDSTHFSWRNNNVSWYKPFTHQHLGEIGESLMSYNYEIGELLFLPQRGNFARGIFATAYTKYKGSIEDAYELYTNFYADAKFTNVSNTEIHLKQVVNTNQCHLHLHLHNGNLLVTSAIDNLLKGASGQAVQNMNLMYGFNEDEGLKLKASAF
ncbi:N-acetyl-gamma-glutamyl-phosphate reductase [Cellulophaga lytica]|uniref:N-acetyl-gamma-glutamyl-phosphate reductase n=1 Tax=Cellulophaga lytica (strain ATCC 23178 / DSM 7489 / JCM 8516 / NBRC 14961 / NCIMB 1423 / VKM B-1433 / Cy l20) TaxID=867900 RepID=F0RCW8_CELLC|nr:N-acetyl-gamma-glutamyl-phosphate reductase [Cellulophaga lytica]ADY28655.1 N-acetyl-gamma-glutamyl-phosphate reductase [Cellulophaga lytica DSM 7489]WQG77166.1 N-acetyl-gamma-glutamyl-phosphate reductase [Cellulophaga lytica]